MLAALDGSRALSAAAREVFDRPVIQRCQLHQTRNVIDKLPQHMRLVVTRRMKAATPPTPNSSSVRRSSCSPASLTGPGPVLPRGVRKSPTVAEVLPLLFLHGLSSDDFGPG